MVALYRFLLRMARHFKKRWYVWFAALALFSFISERYHIAINRTHSLPQKLFAIELGQTKVQKGDFIAFKPPLSATNGFNLTFIKEVACTPGETISVKDNTIYCNSVAVAQAKLNALNGEKLNPISEQVIADNHYFVRGYHKDSFDSRYQKFGLISKDRFVGKAYPIF